MKIVKAGRMDGKTEMRALVLRSVKYGDHDRMLTLFTQSDGKISAVAKGAMSLKCAYAPSVQLFALSDFVLGASQKGVYVCSADLIRAFDGIGRDYERMAAASYMCELADILYTDGINEEAAFSLLCYGLDAAEKSDSAAAPLCALAVALKLTGLCGISPPLLSCIVCGASAESYVFAYARGGAVCASCMDMNDFPMLTQTEAAFLDALLHLDIRGISKIQIPDKEEIIRLIQYTNDYIRYNIGRSPKSAGQLYAI
jgi:DNA repair protein RecO (recombination protein O)